MTDNQQTEQQVRSKNFNRQKSAPASDIGFGKLPPQARELEEVVLGALMIDKDAVAHVVDILRPESFYVDAHQHIYQAILKLFEKSEPIDMLTVVEELKKIGELQAAGGAFYVSELTARVGSSAHVEHHARIISQKHVQRSLITSSSDIIKLAFEDTTDVFDLLDKAEQNLFDITDQNLRRNYSNMSDLVAQAVKQIEELKDREEGLTGVPSGFTNLDRLTSGWQPSDFVIVAGRPGMGKTAFTLALARNASVDFKKPVAFFSLEMSALQLVNRLISAETQLSGDKLRKGNLEPYEWTQLTTKITHLEEAPIFIDDTPGINIFELRAKCRRLKMQHDIQLIMIDYLQLMTGGKENKGNREQEISQISRSLKGLAKELNVPVIALSQLSRAVETRGGDKRPQLSDLRESGAIEQDADMVTFVYRPEYYGITQDEEGNSLEGIGEIIVAKNRHGALENVALKWIGQFAKFDNLDNHGFGAMDMGNGATGNNFQELPPSGHSDAFKTITLGSRMNEGDAPNPPQTPGIEPEDEVPF